MNAPMRAIRAAWTALNDRALNIRTSAAARAGDGADSAAWRGPAIQGALFQDNISYSSADYYYTYQLRRILRPGKNDVFFDIGCGKGRVLCIFARRALKECVGIEVLPALCRNAEENAETLRNRRTGISVQCSDAGTYDLSNGTIYYMFNPFGRKTMEQVVGNIGRSLKANPRRIQIAYHNSECEDVLDACDWLERFHSQRTMNGLNIVCWRSRPHGSAVSEEARAAPRIQGEETTGRLNRG